VLAQAVSSSAGKAGPAIQPVDRLTQPIVESNRVVLGGTIHPLATAANDRGAVSDGMALNRIQVVLKRSDAQEAALKQAIAAMHQKGSASYHQWLTPEEFGKQYGPTDADIATLTSWLGSHGFSVTKVNPGKQTLEIAGTAGQFRDAFHAQIHSYQVKGETGALETRYANASAPEIPAALAPVFGGFVSLNNFRPRRYSKVLGKAEYNPVTHQAKPEWTYGDSNGYDLVLTPGDFAVQYDLNPLYAEGIDGTGQSIAIANDSNIDISLVNKYRSLFGLPANPPQVVIDGNDPGIDGINSPYGANGDSGEAYLDVEFSGAVAPKAQIKLVIADDTALASGLYLAMQRAVYSNLAPVMSVSFGYCELGLGSYNQFFNSLWEQAAAQGITVMVSSGDSGSAGCDDDNSQYYAVDGQAVSGFASTPYNVAVGGTDFYYSQYAGTTAALNAQIAGYWNVTSPNETTPTVSLTNKIPEQPWNDSQFGLNIYSVYDPSATHPQTSIVGGSGGASTCGLATTNSSGTVTACAPYLKPSWQSGTGVPADGARDIPDVSLFAANGANKTYYPECASDGDCVTGGTVLISGVGGTSASAPSFAGMMALVNQKYGPQGQADYVLYPLAAKSLAGTIPAVFNDVTVGTNTVPCATTNITPVDCQTVSVGDYTIDDPTYGVTTEGEIGLTAGQAAYNAGHGYDLATGLGSVDAYNLVTNWNSVTLASTSTTLTPSATTFPHGTAVTLSGTVAGVGGTVPTGNVGVVTTSLDPGQQSPSPQAESPLAALAFPLTAGAYSGTVNYLPGGTYSLYANYPGDSANAPSQSTPVTFTVAAEPSTTALTIYSSLTTNSGNPLAASGATLTYGTPETMSAIPKGSNSGSASTVPTGHVVFQDNSVLLNTAVLNAQGDAEYNAALAPGAHSITAVYSGDGSYNASTSPATSFTVVKDTPVISTYFQNEDTNNNAVNGQVTYIAVSVENSIASNSVPLAPTGTVSVTNAPAGTPSPVTLVPAVDPLTGEPEGIAYFAVPATASGNYSMTFQYAGDANYAATSLPETIGFDSSSGSLASSVTATATATQTSPAGQVTVTVTVTGQSSGGAPTGYLQLASTGSSYYALAGGDLPTSSTDSVTVTYTFDSGSLFQGTNQIVAQYFPADNSPYKASATEVTIANPLSDFSLVPLTTILSVPNVLPTPGEQTDTINLTSYNGFTGNVTLTCASPSAGVTCSLGSNSVYLGANGSGTTTVLVNTSGVTKAGTYDVVITGTDPTGNYVHTIGLQVETPLITTQAFTLSGTAVTLAAVGDNGDSTITVTGLGGFTGTVQLSCTVTGPTGAVSPPTCGSGATAAPGAPGTLPIATTTSTTAGSYSVLVTGTSGNLTATTTIAVSVAAAPQTFTIAAAPTTVAIATQGASGTSTITVTPGASGFSGTVSFTCAEATEPTGATEAPTCSAASVTLSGTSPAMTTLTFNTTAQTGKLDMPLKGVFPGWYSVGGGVAMAALLFFGLGMPGTGRRKRALGSIGKLRMLSLALFFAMLAGAAMGCGGGGGGGGSTGPTGGTTTGTYTYTVTASGTASGATTATTATATVTLTVN